MPKSNTQDVQPQEPQADEPQADEPQAGEQTFEQHHDERGRLRMDRPYTPEEAAAQDAERREQYTAERLSRFDPPLADRSARERREGRSASRR